MNKILAALALLFSANVYADFSPLQRAHEGMWYDPLRPGEFFQIYPYNGKALVTYQRATARFEKYWTITGFDNWGGQKQTAVEDGPLYEGYGVMVAKPIGLVVTSLGLMCDKLIAEKLEFGPTGYAVTQTYQLQRLAPANPDQVCKVCVDPDFGPYPPGCER